MPRATSASTDALWAETFRRALVAKESQPAGEGWKTFKEIRLQMRCGQSKCRRFVVPEMRAGRLERFEGQARYPSGKIHRQVWYRPKVQGSAGKRRNAA
jgi:hypothetical protein